MAMSNVKGDYKDVLNTGEKSRVSKEGLPIDRGWAWAILGGCFLNAMFMDGYNRSLALFFVEYLEMFGASATKTTLILGVKAMTYSLMSLVTMNVLLEFLGTRKTVMMGGLLIVSAILSATFAPNIMVLICVHSVLLGMGDSMIHSPAIVLIGKYFKKRRGLATATASSAMSLASGALRDLSGSYLPCFQYLGAAAVSAAALLLCEPLVRRYVATTREGSPSTDNECIEPLK
ncbi:monocarboxylate transporter 12-like isoform X2 [Haliotis rufescens]|uniref:monocarboxylate transporter 12-like isoform X2 n=1 Tax=Haliotis rufescens TaxID=6454 RepID=UPI00201FAEBE|nr:monocarboxylate transporter 12-like isoform X2 [Haliotis rufescens]